MWCCGADLEKQVADLQKALDEEQQAHSSQKAAQDAEAAKLQQQVEDLRKTVAARDAELATVKVIHGLCLVTPCSRPDRDTS